MNFCGIAEDFAHIIAAAFQRNKAACCQFCFHFQVVWDFNAAVVVVVLLCIKPVSFKTCPLCQFHYEGEKSAMAKAGLRNLGSYLYSIRSNGVSGLTTFPKKDKRTSSQHHPNSLQKHVTAAQNRVHDNNKEIKRDPLLASLPSLLWTDRF